MGKTSSKRFCQKTLIMSGTVLSDEVPNATPSVPKAIRNQTTLFRSWRSGISVGDLVRERFQSSTGRDAIWKSAVKTSPNRHLFEYGFGRVFMDLGRHSRMDYELWVENISLFKTEGVITDPSHLHNFLLTLWCEMGMVGLALTAVYCFPAFRCSRERLAVLPPGPDRMLMLAGTTYVASDLLFGLTESMHLFGTEANGLILLCNVALICWGPAGAWQPEGSPRTSLPAVSLVPHGSLGDCLT